MMVFGKSRCSRSNSARKTREPAERLARQAQSQKSGDRVVCVPKGDRREVQGCSPFWPMEGGETNQQRLQ